MMTDDRFESLADRRIREAEERGDFDDLPGKGKPIPGLNGSRDENWWVKKWVEREGLSILPEGLELRKEVERRLERIWKMLSIEAVRREVEAINDKIKRSNRSPAFGPSPDLKLLNAEKILKDWSRNRLSE